MFNPLTLLLLGLIRLYQIILSPLLGQRCRFLPTCSSYAYDSIKTHGIGRGVWLSIKRIGKCHPWHQGGYDPVPNNQKKSTEDSIISEQRS